MATYTSSFKNPYPDGWKDVPSKDTPIDASALQAHTDALQAIDNYLVANPIPDESGGGSGTTDYNDLDNKPSINGTELSGNVELPIPTKTSDLENDSGFLTKIPEQSYNDLSDKPQINGIGLQGNLTVEELGLLDITESTDTTLENSKDGILKIKDILGNTEQDTTTGKNSFSGTPTESNVYYTLENEKTELDTWDTYIASVIGGESYTVSGIDTTTDGTGFLAFENDTFLGSLSSYKNGTFIVPINCNKLKYSVRKSNKGTFMLEVGTTATPYEPFTNGASPNPDYPQEIRKVVLNEVRTCGKNLAKIDETDFIVSDNYITNKGINSGSYLMKSLSLKANTTYYINLLLLSKPTVSTTFSGRINGVEQGGVSFIRFDELSLNTVYTKKYTPTQDETLDYRMWGNANSDIFNFQFWISTDETDKTYEPYTEKVITLPEPITLNGLGEVRDRIDFNRGVKVQNCYVKIFDGTENFTMGTSTTGGGYYFRYDNNNIPITSNSIIVNGKCNRLQPTSANNAWNMNTDCFAYASDGHSIRFRLTSLSNITSVDALKEQLQEWYTSGEPLTFITPIAEPIETPLPDADVEALKSLKTYDGVTHILTDSEVEPDWLVEYNTTRVGTELDEIDAELVKINKRITDIGTTAQMNYSTEEQVVGTWIDGRPIYQKTITDYDILNTANGTVLIAENLDFLVAHPEGVAEGLSVYGSLNHEALPKLSIDNTYVLAIREQDGYIYIEKGSSFSDGTYTYFKASMTFRYTKTTDTV